jgi:uncharacterized C2H2 Zn-finger protein
VQCLNCAIKILYIYMRITCVKCDKLFTRKYDLSRHLNRKTSCIKIKPTCNTCMKTFRTKHDLTRHEKNKKKCKSAEKDSVEYLKYKIGLMKLEQALVKSSNISKTIVNGNITNTIVNGNITNMVNNGIINNGTINIINPFGNENTEYVTKAKLSKIINHCNNSLRYLGEHIHFNKDHPENHNIRIREPDKNYNRVELHDGNQWNTHNRKLTIPKYLGCLYDTLEELYEQFEPQLGERERRNFRTITKIYYNKNHSYQEKINTILNGLKELLINENVHRVEY